jgi:hypothetical protein
MVADVNEQLAVAMAANEGIIWIVVLHLINRVIHV